MGYLGTLLPVSILSTSHLTIGHIHLSTLIHRPTIYYDSPSSRSMYCAWLFLLHQSFFAFISVKFPQSNLFLSYAPHSHPRLGYLLLISRVRQSSSSFPSHSFSPNKQATSDFLVGVPSLKNVTQFHKAEFLYLISSVIPSRKNL